MLARLLTVAALGLVLAACVTPETGPPPSLVPITVPDWDPERMQPSYYNDGAALQHALYEFLAECYTANGFPSEVTGDGESVYTDVFPSEQDERYLEITLACDAALGPLDSLGNDMSEQDLRRLYEAEVATAECLEERGYRMRIPSFDRWVGNDRQWTAYRDLPASAFETDPPIDELCPQPDLFDILYG